MTPVNDKLFPVLPPPSEEDLGIGLAASRPDTGLLRVPRAALALGKLTLVWLLFSALLALWALYHIVLASDSIRHLAWTAALGAVGMLLGAWLIKARQLDEQETWSSQRLRSWLLLLAFVIPAGQVLLTMAVARDPSMTVLLLLLVLGYSLVAARAESLLHLLTVAVFGWAACQLRCPPGAWLDYVAPWIATAVLSLVIQQRFSKERLISLMMGVGPSLPKSRVIDLDLEYELREAQAARERALTALAQANVDRQRLEEQLRQSSHQDECPLPALLQASASQLAQDVSLQEIGQTWLGRLTKALQAENASLWLRENDSDEPRLALSTSPEPEPRVTEWVTRTFETNEQLIQPGVCALPLDLGLQGRGVILVQGAAQVTPASQCFVTTQASLLNLFLRWQLAEVDSEAMTEELHQHKEKWGKVQQDMLVQENAHHQLVEHLQQQLRTAQAESEQARMGSSQNDQQVNDWKAEAERWEQLVKEAEIEHDTLTGLLEEAEKELHDFKSQNGADNSSAAGVQELHAALKKSEADRKEMEDAWQAAEEQVKRLESSCRAAIEEAKQANQEWQSETQAVSRLTQALRSLLHPLAIFDTGGQVLFENEAAQQLRGSIRNLAGEHPLWKQACNKEDGLKAARNQGRWQGQALLAGQGQSEKGYALLVQAVKNPQQVIEGFIILAEPQTDQTKVSPPLLPDTQQTGPRFFSGLTRTLEPPLSALLDHADALLDAGTDHEARRHALVGVLRHGRQFRRVLTHAFDYAHLEAGTAPVVKSACSPWQLVHQVVGQYRVVAEEKGLELKLEPLGALPRCITTDGERCQRVIKQLLSRALRTTAAGAITVRIGLEPSFPTSGQQPRLQIDVEDQSSSVLPMAEKVFEPFSDPTQFDGGGFGLALAKRQAHAIQGELKVEKTTSSGAVFRIFLPVTTVELSDLIPPEQLFVVDEEPAPALLHNTLQGRVLLVLDGQEHQRVVTYHLERLGLRAEVVAEGETALARLEEEQFAVVLWDWHKLDVSVHSAVLHLRQIGYPGAILAVGSQIAAPQRQGFLHAGGDGVLSRPIIPAIWRQTLSAYLPLDEQEFTGSADALRSEFHADREFMTLIRSYVTKLPGLLAEMRAALQVADLAQLTKLIHATIDSGQLYGYQKLSESARWLEHAIMRGSDSPHLIALLDALEEVARKIDRGLKVSRSSGFLTLPEPMIKAA